MREKKQVKFDDIKSLIRRLEGLLEVVILTIAYYIMWRNTYPEGLFPTFYGFGKYVLVLPYIIMVLVFFHLTDSFQFGHQKLTEIFSSQLISMFIVNLITYLQLCLIANRLVFVLPMVELYALDVFICILCVYTYTVVYHRYYVPRDMLLIYGSENALDLKFKLDDRPDKYVVTELAPAELGFDKLVKHIKDHDAVIINDVGAELRNDLVKYCYRNGIRAYIVPKISDVLVRGASTVHLFDTPILLVKGNGMSIGERFIKRTMDLILGILMLVITSPIMLLVALAVKLDDHGPVFYKQERVTKNGKTFMILKFRSMIVDAEKQGVKPATDRDPRITRVGNFIRATRLDELPQVINIIRGDMSFVGPRPERVEHVEMYTKEIPEFVDRLKVRGGLTGYAQIYGRYNTTAYDKLRLDLFYIENYSVLLDFKLILMTLQIMLRKESTAGFEESADQSAKKAELLARGEVMLSNMQSGKTVLPGRDKT